MGGFSAGGLISGLDTNQIVQQLMQLERQPIIRMQNRVQQLEQQRTTTRELVTQLTTLRNLSRDFRTGNLFNQFRSESSVDTVARAEITGANPPPGTYAIDVLQLASSTVANSSGSIGAAIDPDVALNSSGISTTVQTQPFRINNEEITFDPATESLNVILDRINTSNAGVVASYDASTDRVTLVNTPERGTDVITFLDSGNFLNTLGLTNDANQTGDVVTEVTGTRNLGAINPGQRLENIMFANGAIEGGAFSINGVAIEVNPTDSLSAVLSRINASDAGVSANYDPQKDRIRVVSDNTGSRTIQFGLASDTSNFLELVNLENATQTAGRDAQFTVDGGEVQTRNRNELQNVVSGVTLNLLSTGTTTVSVGVDDDAIVESARDFITQVNDGITRIAELTGRNGALANDTSLRIVQNFMRQGIFESIPELDGPLSSLLEVGVSTGTGFTSEAIGRFELDEEAFRSALATNRGDVAALFSNPEGTGIANRFETYLDSVVATNGFLTQRTRSNGLIDQQIRSHNDRIRNVEDRLVVRERRLRAQFTQMEQLISGFQQQGSSLAGLSSNMMMMGMM